MVATFWNFMAINRRSANQLRRLPLVGAFGFEDAAGFAVEVEDVVGAADVAGGFAEGGGLGADGRAGGRDMPTGGAQLGVDDLPRLILRCRWLPQRVRIA